MTYEPKAGRLKGINERINKGLFINNDDANYLANVNGGNLCNVHELRHKLDKIHALANEIYEQLRDPDTDKACPVCGSWLPVGHAEGCALNDLLELGIRTDACQDPDEDDDV